MEKVILVDSKDNEIGLMDKMLAHENGKLHRAFSVLVFNKAGEMLIQKRADSKYHSGGLWTNACCSHPRPNEDITEAVNRRLKEEMGININPDFLYKFIYKTTLDNGLIEHEYDYVFIGNYDEKPVMNPQEVSDWKYISMQDLSKDLNKNPDDYTVWFRLIMQSKSLDQIAKI